MFHEPFGPRGAEDERDTFWTDLGEVTDAAYRDDPESASDKPRRTVGTDSAHYPPHYVPDTVQEMPLAPETLSAEDAASRQDPLGSWTGVPSDNEYETPTQDADDL
ncbi:hypothetical protein H6B10_00050 [Gemmiger formicilis]|uniref:hypothetical protein n=1 Tax=Gemmiger formicilis TaxID=745368 RepID=UPI00195DCF84|nr:hypothetical protein [Gemmiger formicilis]MBM6898108.1 hypothetical protein [Gemmiger formicilis]